MSIIIIVCFNSLRKNNLPEKAGNGETRSHAGLLRDSLVAGYLWSHLCAIKVAKYYFLGYVGTF